MISFNEPCGKMTFEEFKDKEMELVRKQNHMDLVDSWEKHIIFKEFRRGLEPISSSLFATVYYADESYKAKEFKINIYDFSYHESGDRAHFNCNKGTLYKEEIRAITRLSNCFSRNKDRFFDCTLDNYQKRNVDSAIAKEKEL